MCYVDGQNNKYSVLNECNRMLKYNIDRCLYEKIVRRISYSGLFEAERCFIGVSFQNLYRLCHVLKCKGRLELSVILEPGCLHPVARIISGRGASV
jgi:hypothetical protein